MPFLPETPSGWLGSSEQAEAQKLAPQRDAAARGTGLLEGNLDADLQASFERTTNQVTRFLNAPVGLFSLLDGPCQSVVAVTAPIELPEILPTETSLCTHVRDSGRDIIIDDLSRHELGQVAGNMTSAGANSYLGTPVFSPEGEPIGSLCAIDFPSRHWEPHDLDLLRSLAEGLTDKIALLASLKRAEASEAKLAATLESIPNVVVIFEEHGNVTYVSPQLERDFGIERERFLGHGWADLLHPDDLARVVDYRQEIDSASQPYEYEFRLQNREGQWRNLLSRGTPIQLENGKWAYLSTATEIEGIRRVERELAEERGRLTALLESLPHLVWISDDQGNISYVGPQSIEFLGYRPEELLGNVWAELIHPDDLPRVVDVVMSLKTRTTPFEMEYRLRHRDGRYRIALARGARTHDFQGKVQFVCTATSLEEIRATEQELKNERSRLAALMETIPHIVVLSSLETGVNFVSPQVRAILGHDPESLLGFGFYQNVIHPDDAPGLMARRQEFLERQDQFEYEFRARHSDGRYVPMLLRGYPLPQGTGLPHSHVITFTEIGAIREAEERAESERRRLSTVLDVLPTGVVIVDRDALVVEANAAARSFVGGPGTSIDAWPPAVWVDADGQATPIPREEEHVLRALRGQSVRDSRTLRVTLPEGDRYVTCDAEPLRDDDGEIIGAVMTIGDVTALRAAQMEVQRERDVAIHRMERLIDSLPINVALTDSEGRFVYVNEAPVRAIGLQMEDVIGQYGWESPWIHDEETARITTEEYEKAMRGEIARREFSIRLGPRPDDLSEIDHSVFPIFDEGGAVEFLLVSAVDVTERNRAMRQRETEGELLRQVMDHSPIMKGLLDPEGRVLYMNEAPLKAIGTTLDEVRGKLLWETPWARSLDQAEEVRARVARAIAGEIVVAEMSFVGSDGEAIEVEQRFAPIYDGDGNLRYILPSGIDITERKRSARQREAEGEMLRQVMEHSPIMMGLCDADGRVLYANEAPLKAVGTSFEEVQGRLLWETPWTVNLGVSELIHDACLRAMRGEAVLNEIAFPGPRGEVEVEQRMAPIYAPDGTLRYLLPTAIDVTARNRALRGVESERAHLAQILDHSPLMKCLLDAEGRVRYTNEILLQVFGRTEESVRDRLFWEIPWTPSPEFAEASREGYHRCLAGETIVREIVVQSAAGELLELEHRMAPIRGERGEVRSVLFSAADVTARNRAMRAVEAEGQQARQIMESTPVMMSLLDAQGRLLFVNQAPLRGSGLTFEEIRGRLHWEVFGTATAEIGAALRDAYERASRGETVLQELAFPLPSGGSLEIEHQMAPILDESGEVQSILSTAIDVTERNVAARRVEEERARLRTILDILPAGLLIADAEGRLIDGNAEGQRLFGPSARVRSVDGSVTDEIWPEGWYLEFDGSETKITLGDGPMYRALQGESVREPRTIRMRSAEGSERYVKCDAQPLLSAEGKIVGAVMTILDITDLREARNEADQARLESIERLQRVIDSLPINVVLADKEGRLLYANKAPLEGAGVELKDVVGMLAWESPWVPAGEVAEVIREEYMKAAAGEATNREFSILMGDRTIDVDHSVVPIFGADGNVEFLLPSSVDVTARNEALRQVEEERRRLRQIVEKLPIGLFVFDKDRRILHANEEGLSSFGLSREQMEAQEYRDGYYLEPDGTETRADLENAPLRRVLRGESGREPRIMRLHRPGEDSSDDKFIRAEAAALIDTNGDIEGAVFTVTDVKPLREAEIALAREREAATERLTATLEGVSIFIGLLDLNGKIVWCNKAPLDATGLKFSDVENVKFEDSMWVNHDPEMMRRIAEATRKAAAGEMAFAPIVARRVGGLMDVDITIAPIRGETGEVRYLVASGIEVTARNVAMRQIEDARMSAERAREIAERATRAKDEFLAVLSHELRTPLTPAMLGLELLGGDLDEILPTASDPELAASIQETMGTVRSNLEIQVRLIDDLLDVTRIARGKLELRKSPVDLHDAARHALSIVAPRAAEKEITTELVDGAPQSTVLADPARLRQILWNLLTNAVKFTEGGGNVRIETEAAGPQMVRLKVIDDGLGIEAERLATIFDAFDQGDGAISRGFGGLGLGLAIARSLARAHGGTLWATSGGKGKGATFVLELPTVEGIQSGQAPARTRQVRQAHSGCRVLLIEDNVDTARFTAALLRKAQVEVEVAHSVAHAVEVAQGRKWDAILTDIGLPDGNGVEAVTRLRSLGIDAAAVAMSGYGRDEDKARTADAGFRAHLVKPVVFENLLEVLDAVLPESCN